MTEQQRESSGPSSVVAGLSAALTIDQKRLSTELEQLAKYSDAPAPAVTRVLWSNTDLQARDYIKQLCYGTGLSVTEDSVGNLFARWLGSDPDLPSVSTGSHIDAIPFAGRYDGTVGVLGAIEAVRALQRAGLQPRRTLEVVMFTAEEPTRFGIGCLGSRVLAGLLTSDRLRALRDSEGADFESLRHIAGYGNASLESAVLPAGTRAAFIELHIEQGPLLEAASIPIGIVEHIAAPSSLRIDLRGEGGHAGAVLMPGRRDALLAAAEIALAVEQAALSSGSLDTVATTGVLRIEPGAVNSIPSTAMLEIDVRDIALEPRNRTLVAIEQATAEVCARRGISWQLTELNADPPATCDPALVTTIEQVCQQLEHECQRMISRAYHDALFMARICPTVMIFIPCREGISHRPDEYATPDDIARGVEVLAHTLARLVI